MHHVIILAGGKGTRMQSPYPKVLHKIGGVALIDRAIAAVRPLCKKPTLIIGAGGEAVSAHVGKSCHYIWQTEQRGTGHAVACAKSVLGPQKNIDTIIVLPGDHPLVTATTIRRLLLYHHEKGSVLSVATVRIPHFHGDFAPFAHHGRIVRDEKGELQEIIEQKDATEDELCITEVNASYYCFNAKWLWENISSVGTANAAKEQYLTTLVAVAVETGMPIGSFVIEDPAEGMGVNTPEQSAIVEKYLLQTT